MANNDPSSNPDPDLAPENSPGASSAARTGTRRINKTPMVIVFVLMVLFLIVVIGVMYSRSQRQITQNTEAHTSAASRPTASSPSNSPGHRRQWNPRPRPGQCQRLPPSRPRRLSSRRPIRSTPPGCRRCRPRCVRNPPSKELLCPRRAARPAGENDPEARKLALLQGFLAQGQGRRRG